jgi:predicted ribosomally synthesized peptide with SipW-like signal peptide
MRNRTSTKKALLGSVVALVLCTALLLGTTFAWFTDSATATVGSITAGTLDVALVDANSKSISTLSFDSNAVWAPGNSNSLPTVYVKNNGNLEMKYKLTLATVSGDIDGLEWIG